MYGNTTSTYLTADGVIGASGKRIRVFSATFLSGGTAGILVLRNGAADTGTVYVQAAGTISRTVTVNFEGGLTFPAGCFFDKDTNTASVVVEYRVEI